MKIKPSLLLVFMVLISLLAVSAVSAADNVSDVVEVANADDVKTIDNIDESVAVENNDEKVAVENTGESIAVENNDEKVAVENDVVLKDDAANSGSSDKKTTFGSGDRKTFDFSNITFDFGNGTKIDLGSLLNGTTISLGNGTSFNISSLLNSNMTFGNGTSFNISQIMNMTGNGTGSFNISSILDMLNIGGTKITFNATDIEQVYSGATTFKVTVLENDNPVAQKDVIFTIDNKDYVGRTDQNGTATFKINLKAGSYYIYTEYNNVIGKNKIVIKKASSKITAKARTFKAKTKVKKYTIVLKNNKGKAIKNAKVTLKIKGKTYTAKTSSAGKAIFKITKFTKKGKHTATIKFAGNGYYKASSVSKKITIK